MLSPFYLLLCIIFINFLFNILELHPHGIYKGKISNNQKQINIYFNKIILLEIDRFSFEINLYIYIPLATLFPY